MSSQTLSIREAAQALLDQIDREAKDGRGVSMSAHVWRRQEELRAALSAHPEPREPTLEMIKQGIWAWSRELHNDTLAATVRRVYLAMSRMEDRSER